MSRTVPWAELASTYVQAATFIRDGCSAPGSTASWSAEAAIIAVAPDGTAALSYAVEALTRLAGYLILTGEITHTTHWTQPYHLVRIWERDCDPDPLRLIRILEEAAMFARIQVPAGIIPAS